MTWWWRRFALSLALVLSLGAPGARAQAPADATASAPSDASELPESDQVTTVDDGETGPPSRANDPSAPAGAVPAEVSSPPPRVASATPPLDRSTPRQTLAGFLDALEAGKGARAAQYLDLAGLRWSAHRTPAEAAQQLGSVLRRSVVVDLADLPDTDADLEEQTRFRIATVEIEGRDVPIDLARVPDSSPPRWVFAATTVSAIPELYAATRAESWLEPLVPKAFAERRFGTLWGWQLIGLVLAFVVALPLGIGLGSVLLWLLRRFVRRTPIAWDDTLVQEARAPLRFSVGWLSMGTFTLSLSLPQRWEVALEKVIATPLIFAVGWLLMRLVKVATVAYLENVPDDLELKTRGLRTQLMILRRLSSVVIALITLAIALMQFEVVRSVGWSLLASAGVAGVALGFAAQKSLGAVIAGLQLSITQPLRLGDAVVVQGLWGEVEEISLTYVRVKLFDERRLVVPIEKFLTESFENWSQPGDLMTGIIEIAVDPSAPFATIRAELERLAQAHPDFDGRDCRLQVIDQDERRALIRCRVSTSDISKTFPLRCDIREQLLGYLQRLDGGRYLPRQRWAAVDLAGQND